MVGMWSRYKRSRSRASAAGHTVQGADTIAEALGRFGVSDVTGAIADAIEHGAALAFAEPISLPEDVLAMECCAPRMPPTLPAPVPPALSSHFGSGKILGLYAPIYVALAFLIVAHVVFHYTRFGRYTAAIGSNAKHRMKITRAIQARVARPNVISVGS